MKEIAVIALLCVAMTACQHSVDVAPSSVACAIATDRWTGMDSDRSTRVLVFSEDLEGSLLPLSGDRWTTIDEPGSQAPPTDLIEKFNRTKLVSAVKFCPDFRKMLEKAGVGHGAAVVDKVTKSELDYDVEGVAAPVMSDDGEGALLVLSSRGRDGRVDRVIEYRRRDKSGKWPRFITFSLSQIKRATPKDGSQRRCCRLT